MKAHVALLRIFLRLAFFCLIVSPVSYSQTPTAARRDQASVQLVTQALNAMGGDTLWSQVADTTVSGSCTASSQQGGASSNFRWTTKGRQFRYQSDVVNSGPVYLSSHDRPNLATDSGSVTLSTEYGSLMLPYHLPGLVLQKVLNDAAFGMTSLGTETFNGQTVNHIRIAKYFGPAKIQGTDQDWRFDATSGLPLRVEYRIPSQVDSIYMHLRWDFSGWTAQGTIQVPEQLTQWVSGEFVLQTCNVQSVNFNTSPAETLFEGR